MSINIIEDEIDKKRRELLERGRVHREAPFSPLEVKNPKPGRVYRAVYDDPRRVAEVQSQGYQFPKEKEEEFAVGERKEKRFVYKDTVLMYTDLDSYAKRHAQYRAQLDEQSQAIRGLARENMNRTLVDEGGANAHKDHTFDETVAGQTRNYMTEEE
jgi:hypothetical protein